MSDLNIDELIDKFGKNYPDWLNRSLGIQIASMDKTLKQIYGDIDSVETNVKKLVKNSDKSLAEDKKLREVIVKVNGTLEKISKDKTITEETKKVKSEITKLGKLLEKSNTNDVGLKSEIVKLTNTVEKLNKKDNSSLEKTFKTSLSKLQKSLDKIANVKSANDNSKQLKSSVDKVYQAMQKIANDKSSKTVNSSDHKKELQQKKDNMKIVADQNVVLKSSIQHIGDFNDILSKRAKMENDYITSLGNLHNDIDKMGKVATSTSNSFLSSFGGNKFGRVFSVFTSSVTAAGKIVLDEAERTRAAYRQVTQIGATIEGGASGLRRLSETTNITIEEMSRVIMDNNRAFMSLGRGGAQTFAEITQSLRDSDSAFSRFGYRAEEIAQFMAAEIENRRLVGAMDKLDRQRDSVRFEQQFNLIKKVTSAFGTSPEQVQKGTQEYLAKGETQALISYLGSQGFDASELKSIRDTAAATGMTGDLLETTTQAMLVMAAQQKGIDVPVAQFQESLAVMSRIAPEIPNMLLESVRSGKKIEPEDLLPFLQDYFSAGREGLFEATLEGPYRQLALSIGEFQGMLTGIIPTGDEGKAFDDPFVGLATEFTNLKDGLTSTAQSILTTAMNMQDINTYILTPISNLGKSLTGTLNDLKVQLSSGDINLDDAGKVMAESLGNGIGDVFEFVSNSTLPSFNIDAEQLGWALAGWRLGGPIGAALAFMLGPHMNDLVGNDIAQMIANSTPLNEPTAGLIVEHGIPLLGYMYAGYKLGGSKGAVMGGIAYVSYAAISGATNYLRESSEQTSEEIYSRMPNMGEIPEDRILTPEEIRNVQSGEREAQRYFGPNKVAGSEEATNRASEVLEQARNTILEQARRAEELGIDHGISPEYLRRMQLENLAQGRNLSEPTELARYMNEARQSGFIDKDILIDNVFQQVLDNIGVNAGQAYQVSYENISRSFGDIISGIKEAQTTITNEQARITRSESGVNEYGITDLGSIGGNEIYGRHSSRQSITSSENELATLRQQLEELRPLLNIFGIPIPQLAAGGVAVGSTLANIAEASSPEMVLPLDPALHDMAKHIAEQHVEIVGPMYRRLNNELIYRLFRENDEPIDRTFTKSLNKFFFSKEDIESTLTSLQAFYNSEDYLSGRTPDLPPNIVNALAVMNTMGMNPQGYYSGYTVRQNTGTSSETNRSGDGYAGTGGYNGGYTGTITPLTGNTNIDDARRTAEEYLGNKISDSDWDMLLRATFSEASNNPSERAAVMSVILNRVRSPSYPNTIYEVLHQRNQFQAVTGTRNQPGPSREYLRDRSNDEMQAIADAINSQLFDFAENTWLNFTSNNPSAYGVGTNIEFMHTMRRIGSVVGQSVFGTASGTPAQPSTRTSPSSETPSRPNLSFSGIPYHLTEEDINRFGFRDALPGDIATEEEINILRGINRQNQPLSFGSEYERSFPSEFLPSNERNRQPLSFGSDIQTMNNNTTTPNNSALNKPNDELIKITMETNDLLRRVISRQDSQTTAIKNSGGIIV